MLLKTYQRCYFINAICLFWRICWIDATTWKKPRLVLITCQKDMKDATLTFNSGYDMKDAMLIAKQSICNEIQTMHLILLGKYGKYVFVDQLE